MGLTMHALLLEISKSFEYKSLTPHGNREISKVKFLTKDQKDFYSNELYIGSKEMINCIDLTNTASNILVFSKNEYDVDPSINTMTNLLIIREEEAIYEIFNIINELITNDLNISIFKQCTSLQQLAEQAENLFNNPFIIIDSSFRVIANSNPERINDYLWKNNVEKGYCSYEFIAYVRAMDDVKNTKNNSRPFPLNCYKSPYERYASKIYLNGRLVGYLLVLLQNKKFSEANKAMLYEIAQIAGNSFKQMLEHSNLLHLEHENFLMDLFDNKINSQDSLNEKIKIYNESLKSKYVVICFDLTHYKVDTHEKDFLSNSIDKLLYRRHIYYENNIVLLYDYDYCFEEERLSAMQLFAESNDIVIGISDEFYDLIKVPEFYCQSKAIINVWTKYNLKSRCLRYKQVSYLALALEMEEKKFNAEFYAHPCLKKLKIYDHENGTDFYRTLHTYLLNDQNAILTAKQLFIHRNTVKYRIERIQSIADICLEDKYERINIIISYALTGISLD